MANLDLFVVDDNKISQEFTENIENNLNETLYPGDERKIFTEAVVYALILKLVELNEKFNQRFAKYAHGNILDAHGENENCERLQATKATTTERFAVSVPLSFNVIIPKGTRVTADNEKYFETDNIAVINAGSTSVDVPVSAVEGGDSYNGFTAGQLNKLVDKIEYVATVTNLTATDGGDNGEPYPEVDGGAGDEHYYERIKIHKATKSTAGAEETYKYYAKSADAGISDVYVDSPEAGKIQLAISMADGSEASKDILDKVLEICSAKTVRPLGDLVSVVAITQVEYDIELVYYTTVAEESATVEEVEGTGGAIERYKAWQSETIGRAINPDRLRGEILKSDSKAVGADRVEITSPVYKTLAAGQIAKWSGKINVTHKLTDGVE